ncbi:hypothetical protein BJX70DRAFT_149893 [Aspergillus crustosus]
MYERLFILQAMSVPESSNINFSHTLDTRWYNHIDPCLASRNATEIKGENVQQLQSWEQPLECGIGLFHNGITQGCIQSTDNALLEFIVGGDAEIPHFKLRLSIRFAESNTSLVFTAIWTAWSDSGFDHPRLPTACNSPQESERNTLSLTGCKM